MTEKRLAEYQRRILKECSTDASVKIVLREMIIEAELARNPASETSETPLERLKDVAAMLDHFQQNYQANTGDPMPGNSHYSGKLMAIVEAARAALQEAQHGR